MNFIKKIFIKKTIGMPRYVWHLHHIGLALLSVMILNLFLPILTSVVIIEILFIGKKLLIDKKSNFQTTKMYLKDFITDFNQYQIILFYYAIITGSTITAVFILGVILFVYFYTIDWAYP